MRSPTWKGLSKSKFVGLFLFVTAVALLHYIKDIAEKEKIAPPRPKAALPPETPCAFRQLSPEEALEEKLLLESVAWPAAPPLPAPFSLNGTSHAAGSHFAIPPRAGGGRWRVGDRLEVAVRVRDFQGRPKKHGGDVFLARLHNLGLGAGVAGRVVDHLDGTYTAAFPLLWEGDAHVEITLDHPSEAIQLLDKYSKERPNGVDFFSVFASGSLSESTMCSVCLPPSREPLCNYTDVLTGELWYCYKPKSLSCDARLTHYSVYRKHVQAEEDQLFQPGVTMKAPVPASGPGHVTVFPSEKGEPAGSGYGSTAGPAGYYYQGQWRPLRGPAVRQFAAASDISRCLKGKVVYMYGDSTVRQWLEYLTSKLPDLKVFNPHNLKQAGPYIAVDHASSIFITYRSHGLPIRIIPSPVTELRYIANELDALTGGPQTVVIFGIWAHFTTFPIEYYVRRVMSIRKAVVRLLARAPDTLVVVRTANLKHSPNAFLALLGGNWHSLQRDRLLRAMFGGLDVHFVDGWDMTVAHHLPHDIHPPRPIVENMIAVVLSRICPPAGAKPAH